MHLILLGRGEHDDSLDESAINVHRMQFGNFADPRALAFLIRTLCRIRADILISWLHPADILAYVATRIVRTTNWVMTERDSEYPDQFVYNLRKRIGRRAVVIIANSAKGRAMWESLGSSSQVMQIPNIASPNTTTSWRVNEHAQSTECLAVGRLEPQKNVGMVISAFAQFADNEPRARLLVAGSGSEGAEMLRIAQRASVDSSVEFLGFRKDVPELMARSRLLITLSRHEGMPNVLMEAVAANLPAVVSDIPEHRILLGSDYPFYVPLESPVMEVAEIIGRAWAYAQDPAEHIYRHARNELTSMTPQRVSEAYLRVFTNVISRGEHGTATPLRVGEESEWV